MIAGWWFSKNAGGQWEWFQEDPSNSASARRSPRAFATLLECVSDAIQNGYEVPAGGSPGHTAPDTPKRAG